MALAQADAGTHVAASSVAAPSPMSLPELREPHATAEVHAVTRTATVRRAAATHRVVTHTAPRVVARSVTKPVAKPVAVAPQAPRPAAAPAPAPVTTQPSGSDDYPYRNATTNASDPWGFTERQCVSFVAWRLAQHGHALNNSQQNWGSALTWDDTARRLGYAVSTTARVGTVAQWNAGESSPYYSPGSATANGHFAAGGYGHVGWVKAVYADGSALVEQYNMGGDRSYSVMRVKAPRYLHIG
jgi:surface antigen